MRGELLENMQISREKGELNVRKKTRRQKKMRRKLCCISIISSCKKLAGSYMGKRKMRGMKGETERERQGGKEKREEGLKSELIVGKNRWN